MSMNKRIAEMRGEPKTCEAPIIKNHRCDANGLNECAARGCEYYNYKPYSTDIACAMELAEEMRTATDAEGFELLYDALKEWMETGQPLPSILAVTWLKWKDGS